jgi:hypothetical protein
MSQPHYSRYLRLNQFRQLHTSVAAGLVFLNSGHNNYSQGFPAQLIYLHLQLKPTKLTQTAQDARLQYVPPHQIPTPKSQS